VIWGIILRDFWGAILRPPGPGLCDFGNYLRDRVGRRFPARGTGAHCGSAWSDQIHGNLRPRGAPLVELKGERRLTFSDLAGIGRALL
jgi:hypothetical protein